MKEITGSFASSNKINNIYYRICLPQDTARGIIQISHGMCEYFDRYGDMIEYFTDNGFVVVGSDHMGHGKSAERDEDLGYFGRDSYHCFADDLKQLNEIVKKRYRSLPYILFGHSMGSFVVRDYIARYPDTIDGCIICGTSGTNKALGGGLTICSLLEKLKGERHRSKFVRSLSFSGYNKPFADEKDSVSWLTRDKAVRDKYRQDKFCTFTFTVSGYKNMFSLLKEISGREWAERVPLSLPIYLVSGKDDPVGGFGKGVDEVYDLLLDREICLLKYKLYENCRHEIHNELNRREVMEDLRAFCDEVIEGVIEARKYGY